MIGNYSIPACYLLKHTLDSEVIMPPAITRNTSIASLLTLKK